jgi:hypothetical protein
VSGRERVVERFLLADEAYLAALSSDVRELVAECSPAVAQAAILRFDRRLDRHLRLQTHALFPRLRQARALATLCRTGQRLRVLAAQCAEVTTTPDDRRLSLDTLDALELLLGRYFRQERRLLETHTSKRTPALGRSAAAPDATGRT